MPDEPKVPREDGEVRDSSRRRSRSPRGDGGRDRSGSPPSSSRRWSQKRPKELSFYKRSARDYGRPQAPPTGEEEEESAKERAQRRERGEVPRRFGGTRDQGVRNTMGNVAPAAVGSLKRTADPLDRLGARGDKRSREEKDRDRERDRERDRREREYERDRDRRERRDDRDRRDRDRDRDRDRRDHVHPDRAAATSAANAAGDASTSSTSTPSGAQQIPANKIRPGRMMEVIANDRMGRKVRIKCLPTDTVGDLKKLIAAQTGTSASKIQLKKWYNTFKDHVQLQDYEINDGMSLEMY